MMAMTMLSGDNDQDEHAAAAVVAEVAETSWSPASWHKSPLQLQREAHDAFVTAFNSAKAVGQKRNDPPCPAGRDRPF